MSSWDFIVVGSGSSGSVVANRLSATGAGRVLLLEAGASHRRDLRFKIPLAGFSMRMHPKSSWRLEGEPEPALYGRRLEIPRGKGLGGSSLINGAVYNRGNPNDFEQWASQGLPGWDYASVVPYFRRVENHWKGTSSYHGVAGEVAVRRPQIENRFTRRAFEAARNMGYSVTDDVAGPDPEGFHVPDFNVDDRGRRATTAAAFIEPIRSRSSLDIETEAQVLRVIVEGGRAIGVEYMQRGERKIAHADRDVVLSSGTFGSPQLLLLSGIGPADHLRDVGVKIVHDLPGVGQNLHDQPAAIFEVKTKEPAFHRTFRADRFAMQIARWFLGMRNELSAMPAIAAANMRTTQGATGPDMRFMISALSISNTVWFPGIKKGAGDFMMAMYALPHPRSRGTVTLRSSNPIEPPKILYNLLTDPWDLDEMRRGHKLMREYLAQPALSSVVGEITLPPVYLGSDDAIDEFNRRASFTTQHPGGTCRMGVDDDAVVTGDCRVRGLEGLRVVDLSVLPVQISGNPNGTAIMLGDKVSDAILGRPALAPISGY
ncbi:GMC family oxidoreductase [Rhizorhabdus dicambivorans]|uniref:Glucose-methanol-choline oxidoreductase n=1 Tax=Rhizorhabdus dicambivorans TaxID=1850238 RepID=A0A2A4FPL8_9SPHN|nr:GMC family oxidoreductase N-terminal domain-containing protein [Rhizorhabdus dicambivorans]ATE65729.1 glucose-methanol-choline oxidoreductase [Rhizorhabdus dicambivorans]PCE39650.1 glucose-methanol-choline oxidoreductase [Rhizorhabdus dicambivorans]